MVTVFLLLGAALSLCFFPIECVFATEERIPLSEMDFSDTAMSPVVGYVLLAVLIVVATPSAVYAFRLKEQKRLQLSESIDVEGKTARIINSDKGAVERAYKIARSGPIVALAMTVFVIASLICTSFIAPGISISISSFFWAFIFWIFAAAPYSIFLLTKSAHVLIFPGGKIWYRTHMSLKPDDFNTKDIDFIEEQGIDYTLYLKSGKIKKLYWLQSPPELKEYLIEQGMPTRDKG